MKNIQFQERNQSDIQLAIESRHFFQLVSTISLLLFDGFYPFFFSLVDIYIYLAWSRKNLKEKIDFNHENESYRLVSQYFILHL